MGLLNRLFGRHTRAVWRTETWLMHKLGYVRPPAAVQWISTNVCDLHCPHCYSQAGKRKHGELTTDEAVSLVFDEMVLLDRPILVLAGGEALFRKDVPELLAALKARKIPWAIHSHGGRVAALREAFAAYPPIMAAISFDGTPEVHDAFRGKEGSFDNAVRAIRTLKDIGVAEVVAGTTITRQNADLLADMFPYVLASGADSWGFHLMTPEGRASEHPELLPTLGQLRRAAAFGRRLRSVFHVELDNEWGSAGDDDCFYRDTTFTCGAGRISCVVSATGELMPCTTTDLAESAGNVRDKPLHRLWAEGFAAFRDTKDRLRGDCNDCWLNTRHEHTCRPAFYLDLFDTLPDDGVEHRIPLALARMEVARMKWLWSPFLWAGAALVAGYIVYRIWRGKPVLLRGKVGPRVLRIVAILLVALGLGVDEAQPAQPPGRDPVGPGRVPVVPDVPGKMPEGLTLRQVEAWLAHQRPLDVQGDPELGRLANWRFFKSVYVRFETSPNAPAAAQLRTHLAAALKGMPKAFAEMIAADVEALAAGKPQPARTGKQLLEVLQAMEAGGYYDAWLAAYLWRQTAPLDASRDTAAIDLLTHLGRHVRVTHALIRAHAQVKPTDLGPRVWMSKAGPPAGFSGYGFNRNEVAQFCKVYAEEAGNADLGPWRQDGVALFKLPEKGSLPILVREGKKVELKAGETLRLGRLDVLQTPPDGTTLEHEVFGKIPLPGGQLLLVWDLPRLLPDDVRLAVSKVVRAALEGKEDAARQVEKALPLCQRTLREELKLQPGAPGAARLRLILALFDDAVLLAPPVKETPEK